MPELLGLYENACELIGDDALSAQIISQYRPPPLLPGCTQAVWRGSDGPALVRNYDFSEIRLLRRTVASNPMCGYPPSVSPYRETRANGLDGCQSGLEQIEPAFDLERHRD